MRVLFIGDSIVHGSVGVNWVSQIAAKHPDWKVENSGANGETLSLIGKRLLGKLEKDSRYNVIFFQGGTNDLLIPEFARKRFLFKLACHHLIRRGYAPISTPAHFEEKLWNIVIEAKKITRSRIVLCTIACLAENHDTPLNRNRMAINGVIRKVARLTRCGLADPALRFEAYLQKRKGRDYMLESFIASSLTDKWNSYLGKADQLSLERMLHLTIDGVHLNSRGAAIYKEEALKVMNEELKITCF